MCELNIVAYRSNLPAYYQGDIPFEEGQRFLMLGPIGNMPDHVAVADLQGKVHIGYHKDNFVVVPEEDIR